MKAPIVRLKLIIGILLGALLSAHASAQLIGVDFGPPASSTPNNWNLVSGAGTFTGLIDEEGATTPVNISVSGVGLTSFALELIPSTIPAWSTNLASLTGSIFTFDNRADFLLEGLQPNAAYDVWIFGARDIEGRTGPAFEHTVSISGGASFVQVGAHRELASNSTVGSSAVNLNNYSVRGRTNGSGQMSIAVVDPGNLNILGGGVYLSGLALQPAIEPNAVPASPLWSLLLLTGLLTLLARRANIRA